MSAPHDEPPRDTGDLLAEAEQAGYVDENPELVGADDPSFVEPYENAHPVEAAEDQPGSA